MNINRGAKNEEDNNYKQFSDDYFFTGKRGK